MVPAKLALNAPIRRAMNVQSKVWAIDLRAASADDLALKNASLTLLSASLWLTPVLDMTN
jgi:hypothetical protein